MNRHLLLWYKVILNTYLVCREAVGIERIGKVCYLKRFGTPHHGNDIKAHRTIDIVARHIDLGGTDQVAHLATVDSLFGRAKEIGGARLDFHKDGDTIFGADYVDVLVAKMPVGSQDVIAIEQKVASSQALTQFAEFVVECHGV